MNLNKNNNNRTEDILDQTFANFDTEMDSNEPNKTQKDKSFKEQLVDSYKFIFNIPLVCFKYLVATIFCLYPFTLFAINSQFFISFDGEPVSEFRFILGTISYIFIVFPLTITLWKIGFGEKVLEKFDIDIR